MHKSPPEYQSPDLTSLFICLTSALSRPLQMNEGGDFLSISCLSHLSCHRLSHLEMQMTLLCQTRSHHCCQILTSTVCLNDNSLSLSHIHLVSVQCYCPALAKNDTFASLYIKHTVKKSEEI